MIKVDLHTHSIASKDGRITDTQYQQIIDKGVLDCIAITDHNRIDFAQKMQSKLGQDRIIIGEEITTKQGDIIGLFLSEKIPAGLELVDAVKAIKAQAGLIYIPHPFETVRSGLQAEDLQSIADSIDLIESANGRSYFQNRGPEAHAWAHIRSLPTFASSDAHQAGGLGKTYTQLKEQPTKENLAVLAHTGRKMYRRPNLTDIIAPKLNRVGKKFGAIK